MLKGREAILLETFQKVLDIKTATSQVLLIQNWKLIDFTLLLGG